MIKHMPADLNTKYWGFRVTVYRICLREGSTVQDRGRIEKVVNFVYNFSREEVELVSGIDYCEEWSRIGGYVVLRYAVSSVCNCIDHNGPPRDLSLIDWHCGECRIVGYRWKATKGKTTARPSDGVLRGPLECDSKEGFY